MLQAFSAASIAVLTLLVLSSWPLRSTAVGRTFLALVATADVWSIARLMGSAPALGVDESGQLTNLFLLGVAACALRLALQARQETSRLSPGVEAAIWLPPAVVFAVDVEMVGVVWIGMVFGVASLQLSRVPQRSWTGFRRALHFASAAMLVPAAAPVLWMSGLSSEIVVALTSFAVTGLAMVLFYCLPYLGLLSSARVEYSSVIQAMSDGVLVVDMHDRLVDANQAAREILDISVERNAAVKLEEALARHPDLLELFSGAVDGRSVYTRTVSGDDHESRTYDLQLSALCDSGGAIQNRVLVLRDISDRIQAEHERRIQARHLRLVHEVSAAAHEAHSIATGLEAALALIAETMGFAQGQVWRVDSGAESSSRLACDIEYQHPATSAFSSDHGPLCNSLSGEEGLPGLCFMTGSVCADSLHGKPADARGAGWWTDVGFESCIVVPIRIGQCAYVVFEFCSEDAIAVDETILGMFEHLGDVVGRAVERKLAEVKIRQLAFQDDLTGLPNRQRFHQLLGGAVDLAIRGNRRMALLFLDLDGFKQVNDTLGHEVGDHLLAEVANRFSRVVRVSDHLGRGQDSPAEAAISRLGGDEFTVLLSEIGRPSDAALVAQRLLATLEVPICLAGQELFAGTSIGIAVFPEDGRNAEELLRNADAAMYFAKGRGRNTYQFYSEEMNRTSSSRIEIEGRLRAATEQEAMQLYFQPIHDPVSGEIVAAEALMRWVDEERGFVPPDVFIPVAEETGLIVPLGAWAFRTACAQARAWRDAGYPSLRIGVNVSGHQIREPGMLEMVRGALDASGVSPSQMEFELTESTIMQDDALTEHTLREFKAMGVGLALDDFGTGYSSLSYLRRFTIDRVKIDRSFVNELGVNPADAALTSAIIAMAHGLQLKVVAEGVETAQQAIFLEARGCDEVQGYLYGRPCPADEFEDLLRAQPRRIEELQKDPDA